MSKSAARSVKIKLAGVEYDVPKLNIGQLERVTDILALSPGRATFGVLRIAMERAEPKLEKFDELEPDNGEIHESVLAILKLSGLREDKKQAKESGLPNA